MDDETLASIGEFGLIARVAARLPGNAGLLLGPGDDAAVVAAPDGRVVATTDLLVEGRHFRLDWSSAYDVGRKAAAQNLADVVAMGARPTALLVGLGAPPSWPVADAEALADGLRDEAALLGAVVAGGDVVRASPLVVAVTALGDLGGRAPVRRSGARPGDLVLLAGETGWSALGMAALERGPAAAAAHPMAVARHRAPCPAYDEALALAGVATAMIDTSDGLLADSGHVAKASSVALDFDPAALVSGELAGAAAALGLDPLALALAGGEDHAFVITVPPGTVPPPGVRAVGVVRAGAGVTVGGQPWRGSRGWDHFGEELP